MKSDRSLIAIEDRLGYDFADPSLLEKALTHSSALSPGRRVEFSYQRLEFLGDRVLGLAVAELLYLQYPKANEGTLSRSLHTLVRWETCAAIARSLDLGLALNLGESEARTGGADKDAILADVAEAVIGAIYLDGGIEAARAFIGRHFGIKAEEAHQARGDAKTTLQEWAQGQGLEAPLYSEVERSGPDHAPIFTIEVAVPGFAPMRATGASKKLAEHKAAQELLVRERVWKGPS
jgi:ribonuclease-3